MSKENWKVGDRVLCLKSNDDGHIKAGREYTIDGFSCCPGCGLETLLIVGFNTTRTQNHDGCMKWTGRDQYGKSLFIRPDSASMIEYRLSVTEKELLTVKEFQNS